MRKLYYDVFKKFFYKKLIESRTSSSGIVEEGKLYSVTELASIIKNNIDKIYGTNEVDEEGNPHTGAGIVIKQKNDTVIIYKYIGITSALLGNAFHDGAALK